MIHPILLCNTGQSKVRSPYRARAPAAKKLARRPQQLVVKCQIRKLDVNASVQCPFHKQESLRKNANCVNSAWTWATTRVQEWGALSVWVAECMYCSQMEWSIVMWIEVPCWTDTHSTNMVDVSGDVASGQTRYFTNGRGEQLFCR